MRPDYLKISEEVQEALNKNQPVVALESTVITHGLPWPQNIETAKGMESAVREGGATPATIALIDGSVHVGLSGDQLSFLAQQTDGNVQKCSRRDLPTVMMRKGHGSTTVAATMILSHLAGIEFFATGGIGGVHRGHNFDVSADLYELGKTPVTVICSGAKAILDIPNTLEVLETQGVTIVGYGCDKLPLFYSRESDYDVNCRLDSAEDVAKLVLARNQLGLQTGTLVANPVPSADGLPTVEIDKTITIALQEAEEAGISGAATTPWLLSRIATLSGNRSMVANIALLKNNGLIAGRIASAYQKMVN
ncbi:MAG: pseudouridine-5'-phosphate glycosidase [Chloroflexota bacterium]